ncbi:glycosyl hydrolase family 18 protein [Alicyclobacillus dauci]|uniref:Glycosyl hydrolase family 18 protein n=1 Tax=Alicyclobacillus dauci TaxID=1475485 RepID=A0ABY6ZA55_9BACL|nr:glycosyl hydrolase family 18 protein [Alicyclobacillus dauci]WAH39041.1 glycosyl hydrolase family 18 protein [Alicyclobacillus dauci]
MDPLKLRHAITQFVAATVALMMLGIGCFGAAVLMFGQAHVHRLATFEASQLADVELSELVGTTNYVKSPNHSSPSIFGTTLNALHVPLADPLTMLTNQLPETSTQVADKNQTESSLFRSITTWAANTNKIAMGWLPSKSSQACIQMLQDNPGINVASPVWLSLNDASGNISGNILPSVIDYAHAHHIKVWVLVDNHQFDAKLTHEVLQNDKARTNMIDELVYKAKFYHLDGINLDFENVMAADRDQYTAFVTELHGKLSPLHIDVSVDIAPDIVPLHDNEAFFHAALADAADHVVLMAYDEHWGGDQDPGPVADLPWVKQSVFDLLDTGVPTNKLVLGMPFYTRFWYVHKNGHVTSENDSDGQVDGILQSHQATGSWNATLDLMYARYEKPDGYMEVWYPTSQTFADTLQLVNDNGLAGVSIWSLQLSDHKTWSSVISALRTTVS